ncbi:similar to Saccharomyces cerevisiae YMR102C Protein of unknown function [Maudiozyma saulgeensis]|uniref:Uncharacterized protein n=1 Tax=Maudiozyma saulgeensis TaxID=1789683 RepID=A0A1X7R150_9SACH|nr:similar to Saccharomyces cerevisiae YMR102C Protein of unknown function [Kazachstania saulgeensis]
MNHVQSNESTVSEIDDIDMDDTDMVDNSTFGGSITNEKNIHQNNININSNSSSTNTSISTTKDNKNNSTNKKSVGFAQDIKPVRLKMNKSHQSNNISTGDVTRDSKQILSQVRQQLMKGTYTTSQRNSNSTNIPQIFHSIDIDQFENYLKEPKYIKTFKKARHVKQFRRLFLAQELKVNNNNLNEFDRNQSMINDPNHSSAPYSTSSSSSTTATNSTAHSSSCHPASSSSKSPVTPRAIWTSKFSHDGKYLATAGKDGTIRIWKVISSPIERLELNSTLESNMESHVKRSRLKSQLSNFANYSHHNSNNSNNNNKNNMSQSSASSPPCLSTEYDNSNESLDLYAPVFHPSPIKIFREHTQDVLDLDWSKNNFLISSSMDKTVKLWHPDRKSSLKTFHHPDFVTSISFHPTDDRFFISGCLDHTCRLWSIVDDEISYEFDSLDLITSVTFSQNDGKYTVIGTFNGYIYVLLTNGLTAISSFHITDRKTQSDKSVTIFQEPTKAHHGPRITGLTVFSPPFDTKGNLLRVLVTSNDSRIRVFDLQTKKLLEVIKGFRSEMLSHNAQLSTSTGGAYVICGSDDHWIYCWGLRSSVEAPSTDDNNTHGKKPKNSLKRSDSLKNLFNKSLSRSSSQSSGSGKNDDLTALTMTRMASNSNKPSSPPNETNKSESNHRHSFLASLIPGHHDYIKNSSYLAFNAHQAPVTSVCMAPIETAKTLALSNDVICELYSEFSNAEEDFDILKVRGTAVTPITSNDSSSSMSDYIGSSNLNNVVNAIGSIVVSTDTTGTIRVFRTDIPTVIRKRVLEKIREYKLENRARVNSATSLNAMGRSTGSSSISSTTVNRAKSFTNVNHLNSYSGTGGSGLFGSKNIKPILRSPSMSNFSANGQTPQYGFGTSVTPSLNQSGMYNSPNESLSSSTTADLSQTLKCDICHGSNFKPISKGGLVRGENCYYCLDCGSILNNFR